MAAFQIRMATFMAPLAAVWLPPACSRIGWAKVMSLSAKLGSRGVVSTGAGSGRVKSRVMSRGLLLPKAPVV